MWNCCRKITSIFFIVFLSLVFVYPFCFGEGNDLFKIIDRDPFSPLISKSGILLIPREIDLGGLAIKGIIYSQDSPVAIINDEVVGRGEKIGDYLVLEIEEKRVILKKDDQEFILKLEEE